MKYSTDELLDRLEWRRQIRNVMGRISHDYSIKQEADVYDRYWSKRSDVALGINEGFYVGSDSVSGYYAALGKEIALSSQLIQAKFPDALGEKTAKECYGVGMMTYLPFDSQVIEIAGDGKTAKGIWNVRGSYCKLTSAGPISYWTYGWAAVDFVREGEEWKLWHMQLVYNVNKQCGTAFCEEPKQFEKVPGFEAMELVTMPQPDCAEPLMQTFYPERPWMQSPRCPEPYETFKDTFSYGA